jgi:RHS repeat-associated protein
VLFAASSTGRTATWPWVWRGADPPGAAIDPNGNLASKVEGADTWTYEWNAEDELTRVLENSIEQARFSYDPVGRRVEKVAGGVTSSYTYDGQDMLREVRGGTALKYVQGSGIDEHLAVDDGGALSYFHADGLESIVKVTNAAGAVTLTRHYDAWGSHESVGNGPGYAYTGREWDPEIDLYYYRARYYDAVAGRFISEDPSGLDDDVDLYAYVGNDPTNYVDPTGLGAWKPPAQKPTPTLPPTLPPFVIEPQPPPRNGCLRSEYFECMREHFGRWASETAVCTFGVSKKWRVPPAASAGGCSLVVLYITRENCIRKAFEQCGSCPPPRRPPGPTPQRPPFDWSPDGRPPVRGR